MRKNKRPSLDSAFKVSSSPSWVWMKNLQISCLTNCQKKKERKTWKAAKTQGTKQSEKLVRCWLSFFFRFHSNYYVIWFLIISSTQQAKRAMKMVPFDPSHFVLLTAHIFFLIFLLPLKNWRKMIFFGRAREAPLMIFRYLPNNFLKIWTPSLNPDVPGLSSAQN